MRFGRVAVIGDVGGHVAELVGALVDLGMHPRTGELPDDLTVVQVGDLIHRGPQSDAVVGVVDALLGNQPDRWVQLVGNHEQLYVGEPVFNWPQRLQDSSAEVLRRWWSTGQMQVAAAVETSTGGQWLVTHAGLTVGFWRRLGSPGTAARAAAALNAADRDPDWGEVWRAGAMLGRNPATLSAGPLWASATAELLPGWCAPGAPAMTFNQVHGHSRAVNPTTGRIGGLLSSFAPTMWDAQARHEITTTPSRALIVGVDPGHGVSPVSPWHPWVLDDARVSVR